MNTYYMSRTYAQPLYLVGANGRSPLQMVYSLIFCVSPDEMGRWGDGLI
ncbi:MAG: hypothetical protein SWX82_34370 [Cyanobacteriota bacterium]|nr:hypothetical protein [Cyanobacteriota bacterium]